MRTKERAGSGIFGIDSPFGPALAPLNYGQLRLSIDKHLLLDLLWYRDSVLWLWSRAVAHEQITITFKRSADKAFEAGHIAAGLPSFWRDPGSFCGRGGEHFFCSGRTPLVTILARLFGEAALSDTKLLVQSCPEAWVRDPKGRVHDCVTTSMLFGNMTFADIPMDCLYSRRIRTEEQDEVHSYFAIHCHSRRLSYHLQSEGTRARLLRPCRFDWLRSSTDDGECGVDWH